MTKPGSSYHDPNHHRSETRPNKPFKGRHGHKSKSSLKAATKGKVEKENVYKPKNYTPSKLERRNTQKQIQRSKKEERVRNARFFGGARGAARIVAVVSLCPDVDVAQAVNDLNSSVEAHDSLAEGFNLRTVEIDRFKQTLQYITPSLSSVSDILDTCLPADFILLLLSSTVEVPETSLNTLRSILSQGTPTVIPMVANLNAHSNPKIRAEVKKSLLSYISQYIPTTERIFASDDRGEAATVMRMVCTGIPDGIRWRERRSYILPEGWRVTEDGNVALWGTVRGKPLHVDRLLNLGTWGDYQIEKITSLPEAILAKSKTAMDVDGADSTMDVNPTSTILATPTAEQDSLSPLAEEDTQMAEDTKSILSHRSQSQKGVRIDNHHYFPDDEPEPVKRKSGKTLNDYQEAWHISDSDQSDNEDPDGDEIEMEDAMDDDFDGPYQDEEQSEAGDTASEMHVELSPEEEARQHELFKARETDAHFPDEVEYDPKIPARTRFARYRALKNFRSSPWDVDEPDDDRAPTEWSRLVRFGNWRGTCSRVENESGTGGIKPGVRVEVHLRSCSNDILNRPPRAVYSLMKHENKLTTLNFSVTPIPQDDEDEIPVIKSKDALVVQYASRRYECRPIFSQPLPSSTENNVRKFERYLQPGRTSVASWLGNTVIGKDVPILFFKKYPDGLQLVATGSSMAPTPPIIVKRAILTGHPYRVHKKVVTMRYMFFNREDVVFYKPVQLVSKQGRRGWIKEPLGTHGYFKANFDGKIDKQDTVGLSLYKRIWPKLGV